MGIGRDRPAMCTYHGKQRDDKSEMAMEMESEKRENDVERFLRRGMVPGKSGYLLRLLMGRRNGRTGTEGARVMRVDGWVYGVVGGGSQEAEATVGEGWSLGGGKYQFTTAQNASAINRF